MKIAEILRLAEKTKNTVFVIKYPTSDYYGHAVRIVSDPEIEISTFDYTDSSDSDDVGFTIKVGLKNKKCHIESSVTIPIELADKIIEGINQLTNIDIK